MTLTRLGPTDNFAALNPPNWLRDDLSHLARLLPPTFRLMVLFADDVPGLSHPAPPLPEAIRQRQAGYNTLIKSHFRPDAFMPEASISLARTRFGMVLHNARAPRVLSQRRSQLTGEMRVFFSYKTPPSAAMIVLPPRDLTAAEFAEYTLGLSKGVCKQHNDVKIHRAVLGHEVGHILEYLEQPARILRRASERKADAFVPVLCQAANDTATPAYFRDWRLLSNFLGPIKLAKLDPENTTPSDYWHDLAAHGSSASEFDEYCAQSELKLRGSGLNTASLPHSPRNFVSTLFNMKANSRFGNPMQSLRRVSNLHHTPYRFAAGQELGQLLLDAARRTTRISLN